MRPPTWLEALATDLTRAGDLPFSAVAAERQAPFRDLTLEAWARFPYADEYQEAGRARIARSTPLLFGFERTPRLSDRTQSAVLWTDPELPDRVLLSLGVGFPPPLWPTAEPTEEGIRRAFGPYLLAPFTSAHRTPKATRILRETFTGMGLEGLDHLVKILQHTEWWLDGEATWRTSQLDDPWPEDPSTSSMIQLRVIARSAQEEDPAARPAVAMRTLWSRSVLIAEAGSCGSCVFELRYRPVEPDERVALQPGLPNDLPVDLAASLLRGNVMTPRQLRQDLGEKPTPDLLIGLVELDSGETTTFARLAEVARAGGELSQLALELAKQEGARGLLYELACETEDPALRARLEEMTAIRPAAPASPKADGPDDDDDDEFDGDEDDDLDDDLDEDDEDGGEDR